LLRRKIINIQPFVPFFLSGYLRLIKSIR